MINTRLSEGTPSTAPWMREATLGRPYMTGMLLGKSIVEWSLGEVGHSVGDEKPSFSMSTDSLGIVMGGGASFSGSESTKVQFDDEVDVEGGFSVSISVAETRVT